MNTFLPYPDIIKSVQCLDNKRLGKQRVEAYQILRVLAGLTKGWKNHPAVQMWRGYEDCLEVYYNECVIEWKRRGFKNRMELCIGKMYEPDNVIYPEWFGNPKFHSAHRASLLAKNYEWYSQFGWTEEPKIEYYWTVK
jgi:hypothetical protein